MSEDDRRDFLKAGLAAAAGAGFAALPLAAASEQGQKVVLAKPISVKILENKDTTDGDRSESRSKFDLVGSNGAVHRITGYSLKIEREDDYDTTVVLKTDKFLSESDAAPADSELRVIVVSGQKGEVKGDLRKDEIQITAFGPEGIYKSPPQFVDKSLVDPYAGLSVEQKVQAIVDSRIKNPRA